MEQITEGSLFERLINLELEKMATAESFKELKKEAKEGGIAKEDIALVATAAKLHVKDAFEEKTATDAALVAKYKELTGYDEDEPRF